MRELGIVENHQDLRKNSRLLNSIFRGKGKCLLRAALPQKSKIALGNSQYRPR
jgi:hypothetical protein